MNNPTTPHLPTTRREFLRLTGSGLGLLAFSAYAPRFLTQAAGANVPAPEKDKRILVLVQLAGGNDGLNTVIPYSNDLYYNLRPTLGIKDVSTMHKLDDHLALAPPCGAMADLVRQGKFAVIQNVGYPNPNRSHFRSSEIWETASDADAFLSDGWMGRYLDNCCAGAPNPNHDPSAVHSTTTLPQSFFAKGEQNYFSIADGGNNRGGGPRGQGRGRRGGAAAPGKPLIESFAEIPAPGDTGNFLSHTLMDALVTEKRVQQVLDAYRPMATYPNSQLAQSLQRVVALIAAGLETRVYFCSQTGFDTHANQFNNHQNLLRDLSEALAAFQKDLEAHGLDQQVLTMTFSEFGRRPYENDARGTDHGTAAPLFVMGGALQQGGVIGEAPNLNIPEKGDITYKIDFRQVYATVLHRWLEADPSKVLADKFEELPFLGTAALASAAKKPA
jgi:uncharacterized protein (DUF1501 family)